MKNRGFFSGAITLVLFNLIGKVVGSFYRISLASILGGSGMGLYQLVFPLYCFILTISTSGIPVAVSKMVAEFNEKNRVKDSKKLLKISIVFLLLLSVSGALIIVFGAKFAAKFQGNSEAYVCYYAIAPSVVFVGVLSAFRGYFQGNLKMYPTAISGLIEQILKLGFGLFLSKKFSELGTQYAVFGALAGVSISEFFALLFLIVCYFFIKIKDKKFELPFKSETNKFLAKSLISMAVPITLGGIISPVTSMIDSFLVVKLLIFSGESSTRATTLLGLQAGVVEPLVNLPVTIAISIAVVLLPNISRLKANGENEQIKRLIFKGFQVTMSIAICSAVCYVIFGSQVIEFLYGRNFSPDEILIAIKLLFLASVNIIFLALVQISASALQGLGESRYTVRSLLFGSLAKIATEVALLLSPLGIFGAVISGAVCYLIVFSLNLKRLKKVTGIKVSMAYFYVSMQAVAVCVCAFVGNWLIGSVLSPLLTLFVAGGITVLVFAMTYYKLFMGTKALAFRKIEVK